MCYPGKSKIDYVLWNRYRSVFQKVFYVTEYMIYFIQTNKTVSTFSFDTFIIQKRKLLDLRVETIRPVLTKSIIFIQRFQKNVEC